jgi:hypothetical protein
VGALAERRVAEPRKRWREFCVYVKGQATRDQDNLETSKRERKRRAYVA